MLQSRQDDRSHAGPHDDAGTSHGSSYGDDDGGAADAFFAPIVARFISYHPALTADSRAYVTAIRTNPWVNDWYEAAAVEPADWFVPKYEITPPASAHHG